MESLFNALLYFTGSPVLFFIVYIQTLVILGYVCTARLNISFLSFVNSASIWTAFLLKTVNDEYHKILTKQKLIEYHQDALSVVQKKSTAWIGIYPDWVYKYTHSAVDTLNSFLETPLGKGVAVGLGVVLLGYIGSLYVNYLYTGAWSRLQEIIDNINFFKPRPPEDPRTPEQLIQQAQEGNSQADLDATTALAKSLSDTAQWAQTPEFAAKVQRGKDIMPHLFE